MYRIWRGCRLWAADDGFKGDDLMRETAKRFRRVVERTQPSWDIGTISGLQKLARKTPLAKFIPGVMFSSQRNQNAQIVFRAFSDWAATGFSARKAPGYLAKIAVPTLANALGLAIISGLWVTILGGAPKSPEEQQKRWANFYMDILRRFFGNWLFGGDILAWAIGRIEAGRGKRPPWYSDTPDNILEAGVADAGTALYYMGQAINEQDPAKYEKAKGKAVTAAAKALGRPFGITGLVSELGRIAKRNEPPK
jgi:hypothetical protein